MADGATIIYSGYPHDGAQHTGVAFMLTPKACRELTSWESISSRLITAKLRNNHKRIATVIIQSYSPTNDTEEEEKSNSTAPSAKKWKETRDFNAKIGKDNTEYEQIMGRHRPGEMNENGEMFADFCSDFKCVIGSSVFPHKEIQL